MSSSASALPSLESESDHLLNLREQKQVPALIRRLATEEKLNHLVSLNLEYTDLDDETLQLIGASATSLTQLNLNVCQEITDSGVEGLVKKVTRLAELSLYWNVKLTDSCVDKISQSNTNLTTLVLSGCKQVTDHSLNLIADRCRLLTTLDLTRCPKITDKGLETISSHCTSLSKLLLYASSGFGDIAVAAIVSSLHNLEILDLCGTGQLTDQGFEPCRTGSISSLRKLNIGWCPKLTNETLVSLSQGCPALEYLYLLGNPNMTMDGLNSLAAGCTRLRGMDVCGLRVPDRSMAALQPLFPNLTSLAKLGQAPNYDDY